PPTRLSGLFSCLPRRGLWRHRTKGEHEHECCPAVEHGFLQADETGPLQELLNWVEQDTAVWVEIRAHARSCQANGAVQYEVPESFTPMPDTPHRPPICIPYAIAVFQKRDQILSR